MDPLPHNDDDIVRLCQQYEVLQLPLLSQEGTGRKVVRIADYFVVKFGLGVTAQEASAQQLAFQQAAREYLRIPRVYRFFERTDAQFWKTGYLVMEYIEGERLDRLDWEHPDMLIRVVAAVNAVNSIPGTYPGPVSGGEAHHSLWSESGSGTAFQHVQSLEAYMNDRLSFFHREMHIREDELRLCHMDLAPRNFILDRLGRLCLLDWATAGFFPRYFELWAIEFTRTVLGAHFGPDLVQRLEATREEISQFDNLTLVYRYNASFASQPQDDETDLIMAALADPSISNTA